MFGYVRPAFWSARGPVQTAINKRVGRLGKQSAQGPWPLPERQSPDTDAFAIRRDCGAFRESVLALNVHCSDQIGLALRVKPLDTQQHHRRTPVSSHCKVRVEIVVQRYTHAFVVTSPFQNLHVLGLCHSDFGDMNRVPPVLADLVMISTMDDCHAAALLALSELVFSERLSLRQAHSGNRQERRGER